MKLKGLRLALAGVMLVLLVPALAGCGREPGPHNDQERLADRIITGWLAGDIQPALDAVPPDYLDRLRQYAAGLTEEELRELVAQPVREALGAFQYEGAAAEEIFYETVEQGADACRVIYWGSIKYERDGQELTVTRTRQDAVDSGGLALVRISGTWYWDLALP